MDSQYAELQARPNDLNSEAIDSDVKPNGLEVEYDEELNERVDDNVVRFMEGLFERIHSSSGATLADVICSQAKWYNELNPLLPQAPIVFSYDQSRSETDALELRRATNMRTLLEPSYLVLRRLSDCIASQLEACKNQVTALNARAAFASLSDEILSLVMEYAAYHPEVKTSDSGDYETARSIIKSVGAAIELSSVCSRFRRIVIHTPHLWNRVCIGIPLELLAICVERVGTAGLHVFFDITIMGSQQPYPREELIRPFLKFVTPFAGIWRRFDYHCFPFLATMYSFPIGEMENLQLVTEHLFAPQLKELAIQYVNGDSDISSEVNASIVHYYSTWDLPNLRSMSTLNIIPIPFSGSTSITSLSIDMDYSLKQYQDTPKRLDVAGLTMFLSSCPALTKLSLRLVHALWPADRQLLNRVTMANVKELVLCLDQCDSTCVQHFLDTIHFPRIISMKFTVVWSEDVKDLDHDGDSNVRAVFSNPSIFPRLEQLHFVGYCSTARFFYINSGPKPARPIRLPIHNIPSLKSLRLPLNNVMVAPVLDDDAIHVPAHLCSLRLDGCEDSESVKKWLAEVLRSLEAQGRQDSLHVFSTPGVRSKATIDWNIHH